MTREEKQLLLKDLCNRLLYGVIYHRNDGANIELREVDIKTGTLNYTDNAVVRECKPYLRPMSSMSEEEKKEFESLGWRVDELDDNVPWNHNTYNVFDGVDWLNKKMFDYRGLIPMGLALEAKEGMYD